MFSLEGDSGSPGFVKNPDGTASAVGFFRPHLKATTTPRTSSRCSRCSRSGDSTSRRRSLTAEDARCSTTALGHLGFAHLAGPDGLDDESVPAYLDRVPGDVHRDAASDHFRHGRLRFGTSRDVDLSRRLEERADSRAMACSATGTASAGTHRVSTERAASPHVPHRVEGALAHDAGPIRPIARLANAVERPRPDPGDHEPSGTNTSNSTSAWTRLPRRVHQGDGGASTTHNTVVGRTGIAPALTAGQLVAAEPPRWPGVTAAERSCWGFARRERADDLTDQPKRGCAAGPEEETAPDCRTGRTPPPGDVPNSSGNGHRQHRLAPPAHVRRRTGPRRRWLYRETPPWTVALLSSVAGPTSTRGPRRASRGQQQVNAQRGRGPRESSSDVEVPRRSNATASLQRDADRQPLGPPTNSVEISFRSPARSMDSDPRDEFGEEAVDLHPGQRRAEAEVRRSRRTGACWGHGRRRTCRRW